jgi:hypothetical protein
MAIVYSLGVSARLGAGQHADRKFIGYKSPPPSKSSLYHSISSDTLTIFSPQRPHLNMCTLLNGRPRPSPANAPTMRTTVWNGSPYQVTIKSLPKPHLKSSEDALVRLTSSAICGTDLHLYRGILGSANIPWVTGHEGVGIVQEVGEAVQNVKPGDRVIMSCIPDDGVLKLDGVPNLVTFGGGTEFGVGKDEGMHGKLMPHTFVTCTFQVPIRG